MDMLDSYKHRLRKAAAAFCAAAFLLGSVRYFLYRTGLLRRYPLGTQVISIGNVTAGGTGKTPVTEIFARTLAAEGRKVAILSRGYRRKEAPWWQRLFTQVIEEPLVVSDGRRVLLDSATGGDEPYMLASNLPGVAVVVDRNRVKAGRYAVNRLGCDTLILDDGFQYQKLKHSIEVVLVDSTNPFGNGNLLPRGITARARRFADSTSPHSTSPLETGTNAAVSAPSPKSFRAMLGIANASVKADCSTPAPMRRDCSISRTSPSTLLKAVKPPTVNTCLRKVE